MSPRRFLETLWLVRVPVLSLFLLAIFGFAAAGSARSMLEGLFDLEGDPLGLFTVNMMAFLVAAACIDSINMVLYLGAMRFEIASLRQPSPRLQLFVFLAAMVFPLLLISRAGTLTPDFDNLTKIGLAVAGFTAAMLLVFVAKVIQMYLTDKDVTIPPPPFLVFPASYILPLNNYLRRVYAAKPGGIWQKLKSFLSRKGQWFFGVLAISGEGYFVPAAPGLVLESAQVFTATLTVLSLAIYIALGAFGHKAPGPALAYVLLFQMVATWALAGLCFFFDRFRVPVLLVALVLTRITSDSPESDHLVHTQPLPVGYVFPLPAEVLGRHQNQAPVLVATAGGGIQAAAWTTTVMAGLARDCHCDLASRLAVFSGVSGGSVGAMNIGSVWPDLERAKSLSRRPSLNAIAWGLVNPDVLAALLPAFHDKFLDRGRALEESWEAEEIDGQPTMLAGASLAHWSRRIAERQMPAFLFNSTNVESGAPVVFATTQFPKSSTEIVDKTRTARSFHDIYAIDLSVATAVRLSASFPYVSPAARPYLDTLKHKSFHFVDGGYYDNYGVYTLLSWLENALQPGGHRPRAVALVRIMAFPKGGPASGTVQGWGYQRTAPLSAFLSTRETGQLVESDTVLSRFVERWSLPENGVQMESFVFQYPELRGKVCSEPALSWTLTAAQKKCLDTAWQNATVQQEAGRLASFLRTH